MGVAINDTVEGQFGSSSPTHLTPSPRQMPFLAAPSAFEIMSRLPNLRTLRLIGQEHPEDAVVAHAFLKTLYGDDERNTLTDVAPDIDLIKIDKIVISEALDSAVLALKRGKLRRGIAFRCRKDGNDLHA